VYSKITRLHPLTSRFESDHKLNAKAILNRVRVAGIADPIQNVTGLREDKKQFSVAMKRPSKLVSPRLSE